MENDISRLLRSLHLEMKKKFNRELESFNLTAVQCQILLFLFRQKQNEKQEINQKDIEKMYGLSNPTVSGILKRMEEKELIVRNICKKDGRYKKIEVADKAIELKNQLHERGKEADSILVHGLSQEEQKEFKRIIEIMINNIKDIEK